MPADILGVPVFAIKVNGQSLKDTVLWQITRITVDDQVDLPSMFTLELDANEDNQPAWLDDEKRFAIGDEITIQIKSADTDLKTVISGEVTFLEVECSASQPSRLLVRGYDRRHRLQRGHKMRSFVKLKDSEIVKKIASEAGLSTNAVDSKVKHEYIVQANQTDFAFLQERARQIHYELLIQDKTLIFLPVANDKSPSITLSSEAELT
jgi:phage protein D